MKDKLEITAWEVVEAPMPIRTGERLAKSLPVFAEVLPERRLAVCRELTKLHEEVRRGTAAELLEVYGETRVKGEIVVVLEGCEA